jgi:hypothetical protein
MEVRIDEGSAVNPAEKSGVGVNFKPGDPSAGIPPRNPPSVGEIALDGRGAVVVEKAETLLKGASDVGIIDQFKAWIVSGISGKGWNFDAAKRAATVSKVADGIRSKGDITLIDMAENAGGLLTKLNSEEFSICLDAMKAVGEGKDGAGKSKLSEFKAALKKAIEGTVEQFKQGDTSPLSSGDDGNFYANARFAAKFFEGESDDIGIDQEILSFIKVTKLVSEAENGTVSDAARLCAEDQDLVGFVTAVRDSTIAAVGKELGGQIPSETPTVATVDTAIPETVPDAEGAETLALDAEADALAPTAAETKATPSGAKASPAIDAEAVEKIADLSARCRVHVLVEEAGSGDIASSETFISRMRLANRFDTKIKDALIRLYNHDRDTFQRHYALAEAYPDIFANSSMISTHASTRANFSEVLRRLETQMNDFDDPEAKEALVYAYAYAAGYSFETNVPDELCGSAYNLTHTEALLDFVEKYKNFLSLEILQYTRDVTIHGMQVLENLLDQCQDHDKKQALVKLFATSPEKFGKLHTLAEGSANVLLELIDPCDKLYLNDFDDVIELKKLKNVKLGTAKDLLRAYADFGGDRYKTLLDFAKAFPNVEINAELAKNFSGNSKAYQKLFDLAEKFPSIRTEMNAELLQKFTKNPEACQKLINFLRDFSKMKTENMSIELVQMCIENPEILDVAKNLVQTKQNKNFNAEAPEMTKELLLACANHLDGARRVQRLDIGRSLMYSDVLIKFIKLLDGDVDDKRFTAAQSLLSQGVDRWKIISDVSQS